MALFCKERLRIVKAHVLILAVGLLPMTVVPTSTRRESDSSEEQPSAVINATTLHKKVLCGYQGWFRCPGDSTSEGWRHWSRDSETIHATSLTFDMWPDMTELADDERYPAPGFHTRDGTPATLFSSANARTIERHFEWMKQYGIDGVFLQRFVVNLGVPSFDRVLEHVRASAKRTGRVYAICYDMTSAPTETLAQRLFDDWTRLVDQLQVTRDDRYLHHQGRPVVFIWGFYPDRFPPQVAHRIIDLFQADGPYRVWLVGGCPWWWRSETDPAWSQAFRRFDVISPWNVGNVSDQNGIKDATTHYWKEDLEETRRAGIGYLPVLYPGFSWRNLQGPEAITQAIPRRGGSFLWRQFVVAADLGVEMAYIAMFDEVDEGTAIFKVTNAPPPEAPFMTTYEGRPTDWYLRLTGKGSSLLRGERPNRAEPVVSP